MIRSDSYCEACLTAGAGLNDPMSLQTPWNTLQMHCSKETQCNAVAHCAPLLSIHSGFTTVTWGGLFFNTSLLAGEKMKVKSSSHPVTPLHLTIWVAQ